MNAADCTNAVMDFLGDRLHTAAHAYGFELLEDVQGRINVPVEYVGSRIIRSKPGEPPRRETGDYRFSWTSDATRDGDTIRAVVGTVSNIGPILEYGTSRMAARPHVQPAHAQAASVAAERIASRL